MVLTARYEVVDVVMGDTHSPAGALFCGVAESSGCKCSKDEYTVGGHTNWSPPLELASTTSCSMRNKSLIC